MAFEINSTAQAGRTFRLFVSSTFSDLQEERNALHQRVFPLLRRECEQHGARFQAIDLRWGVSTEAGLDQRTMPLCLAEIERCQVADKPNFLVLLGDRYGWRPLPATIPATEFDAVAGQLTQDERRLAEFWYRLDENAVPAEYYLRRRAGDGDYGDSPDGHLAWADLERELARSLRVAAGRAGLAADATAKYTASATEQEIEKGALQVADAAEHVFCFFRAIEDLPHDSSSELYQDIIDGRPDTEARSGLAKLKQRLRLHVPDNMNEFSAQWLTEAQRPSLYHIDELCRDVLECLRAVIRGRFAESDDASALEREVAAHERFGRNRAQVFVGRRDELATIADYLSRPDGRLLVVHGESGSGKSALMAKAAAEARAKPGKVIVRFVAATASSTEGRSLLADLCHQIGELYGDESDVPADLQGLVDLFGRRLQLATADRPLTLFIDAVDQLGASDPARNLAWLPAQLQEGVAVVASTLPGDTMDALLAKGPQPKTVEVGPMPSVEAEEALDSWLEGAGRTLQPSQRAEVLGAFQQAGLPLYLMLSFEEAKLWKAEGEHPPLGRDVATLIRANLFRRLAKAEHHGSAMVSRTLSYLAASRYGLAEDELLSLLARDDTVMSWLRHESMRTGQPLPEVSPGEPRIPAVLWSRLYSDLEPYLAERPTEGARALNFFHRQFGEVAKDVYLSDGAELDFHVALAGYFESTIDPDGDHTWGGPAVRGLSELPYHLIEAKEWEKVETVLTDFGFLERKVAEVGIVEGGASVTQYTGVYQLLDDYDHVLGEFDGHGTDGRTRVIVTAVNLGNGLGIGCPHCNRRIPWQERYRGQDIPCPLTDPDCGGPLQVNEFVVGER